MRSYLLPILVAVQSVAAQGVTDKISPPGSSPAGCSASFDGSFEIAVVDVAKTKRDFVVERAATCSTDGILVASLANGVVLDSLKRTGYIASNFQFQFDGPAQAGAIFTAGFSVCGNGSLALGPSTTFYKCQSGSFYNLYDRHWAPQCSPVQIQVIKCGTGSGDAGQRNDGQVVGTTARTTTVVVPLSDGQPQVITTVVPVPLCQIDDGQLQAHTTPCAALTSIVKPTAAPVSQFPDGQIQVTTAGPAPAPTTQPPVSKPTNPLPTNLPSTTLQVTTSPPATNATTSVSRTTTSPPASTSVPVNNAQRMAMSSFVALVAAGVVAVLFI